ncbi:MAG: hypothetical protein NVS1B9_07980 [Solirubrobacteraceae bacterium]
MARGTQLSCRLRYPRLVLVFNAVMRKAKYTLPAALAALLLLPGAASAMLSEVGLTKAQMTASNGQPLTPSCPNNPCLAVSRTTGFQIKVGAERDMFTVPRDGVIVAWSINLGKPSKKQIAFFDVNEGGAASAGIAVLHPGKGLNYKLRAQSPVMPLVPYFGVNVQFPLAQTIPVKKGEVIALTVPTWAPALALGFGNDTSWRASRPKAKCTDTTTQTAQMTLGTSAQYPCLYRTARLAYTATLISTP